MTDPKFEAKLRSALLELNREELEEVEKLDPIEPSPRYLQWRMRFLADPFRCAKKYARPTWRKVLRIALSAVLAVLLTFGTVLAVYPPARQWVAEWFKNYTVFSFSAEQEDYRTPGHWYPDYLPDGFELAFEEQNDVRVRVRFSDSSGINIDLRYLPEEYANFYTDSEYQTYSEYIFSNGIMAALLKATSPGQPNYIIWTDPESHTAFKLMSPYDINELIKIAESLNISQ